MVLISAILLWLVLPHFQGATWIFDNVLDPQLNHYEKDIDTAITDLKRRGLRQIETLGQMGVERFRNQGAELIKRGTNAIASKREDDIKASDNDNDNDDDYER